MPMHMARAPTSSGAQSNAEVEPVTTSSGFAVCPARGRGGVGAGNGLRVWVALGVREHAGAFAGGAGDGGGAVG